MDKTEARIKEQQAQLCAIEEERRKEQEAFEDLRGSGTRQERKAKQDLLVAKQRRVSELAEIGEKLDKEGDKIRERRGEIRERNDEIRGKLAEFGVDVERVEENILAEIVTKKEESESLNKAQGVSDRKQKKKKRKDRPVVLKEQIPGICAVCMELGDDCTCVD
ncbi:MAG: hypothetical protein VX313_05630 [Bacteroidota bacterium]|nr:hypothetical protein [Bacteroidota bacterium]